MDRECVNSYCAEYRTKSGENINKRMILLRWKKYHNVLKYESPFIKRTAQAKNPVK